MSARLLLEIALRVLGIWFFIDSIPDLMSTTSFLLSRAVPLGQTDYILVTIVTIIARMLLGGAMVLGAPAVAARFYPPDSERGESRLAVGSGDIYRTACFVLGAYLLVATAHPAGLLLSAAVTGGWQPGPLAANAVTAIVYVFSGLLLVFGSRRIAEMLSNLRYDPDTIPRQQISLAMLLILLGLIAVVLGVARRLSLGM